jgi:hypothetical protein
MYVLQYCITLIFKKIFSKELLLKFPSDTNCRLFPYHFLGLDMTALEALKAIDVLLNQST